MNDNLIKLFIGLAGTSLATEIYKSIASGIRASKEKRNHVKSIPQQMEDVELKLDALGAENDRQFREIRVRLENVEKLDGRLVKMERALKRNGEGTGISLSVDKAILEGLKRHGYDLNGEGKEAENELNQYLLNNTVEGFQV